MECYIDGDSDLYGAGDPIEFMNDCPSGYTLDYSDCDDNSASINPGAEEICDEIDNDCDSDIDEGVLTTYYPDSDGDNYGDGSLPSEFCIQPLGYTENNGDCDDNVYAINPGATEVCDEVDNNCDFMIDEGVTTTYYSDYDMDNFGDAAVFLESCSAPGGYVTDNTDCNDSNPAINPLASEICNTFDDDCDGFVDEEVTSTFYQDMDDDTYGNPSASIVDCSAPLGYVLDNTDCDDMNSMMFPGNPEICDQIDNDCDLLVDNGLIFETYYVDADEDNYGSMTSEEFCEAPSSGYSQLTGDCNDSDANINPGETEVCNAYLIDENCNSMIDEGYPTNTYYTDNDADGYGTSNSFEFCFTPSTGYATVSGDCDDNNSSIYPNQTEYCNSIDDNCNGQTDEGIVYLDYFFDNDNDGYGSLFNQMSCTPIIGSVTNNEDCDDNDENIGPSSEAAFIYNNVCYANISSLASIISSLANGDVLIINDAYSFNTPFTIPMNSIITLNSNCSNQSIITNNGTINSNGSFINNGSFKGKGVFNGNFTNSGNVSPGN